MLSSLVRVAGRVATLLFITGSSVVGGGVALATPVDIHGAPPAVPSSDPSAPITVWAPRPVAASAGGPIAFGGAVIGEYATGLLSYQEQVGGDGGEFEDTPILTDLVGLNASAYVSPISRLTIALTVPVFPYLRSDVRALGTLRPSWGLSGVRAAVPITILAPTAGETGFSLGVVPWITVPVGRGDPLVRDAGPSGGGVATARLRASAVDLVANGGVRVGPVGSVLAVEVHQPVQVPLGAAVGVRILADTWLHAEATATVNTRAIPVASATTGTSPGTGSAFAGAQ
ncbi:MAG: hypothetical protein ABMB14_11350, partial [Myxococcota bacterium]